MILATLWACGGLIPFRNEAPRLRQINGEPLSPADTLSARLSPYQPGEPYELWLDVWDPEGHEILVWFPDAPGQIDFPPDHREGVIEMYDKPLARLWIVLEDLAPEPRQRTVEVEMVWIEPGSFTIA